MRIAPWVWIPAWIAVWLSGCTSAPPGEEEGLAVAIRSFLEKDIAPGARHRNLGITAAAILAEQFVATEGYRLVAPRKTVDTTQLAWERRCEVPSRPIPVAEGEGEAEVDGEVRVGGGQLKATARYRCGPVKHSVRVEGLLGEPDRNKLLFRKLALRLLVSVEPEDATRWVRLGITLREEGLIPQALEAYSKAISLRPSLASAHYNMGVAFDAIGEVGSAVAAYRKAVEADPTHLEARYNWALNDLRAREEGETRERFLVRVSGAQELLRQVTAMSPQNAEARFLLVKALELQGKFTEALEECRRIQRIFPGDSRPHEYRGTLLLHLKRYAEALKAFRKTQELDPGLLTNAYFLGAALEGLGRIEEAAAHFEEFVARAGDDPKFQKAREDARKRAEALRAGGKETNGSSGG